jgi:hypothetical protein
MAMTFTILTGAKSVDGSIKSWMNYARVDAEGVLLEAETMIAERLRVREMRVSDTLPVSVGDSGIDLPDQFLDPIEVRDVTNDSDIEYRDPSDLERMRSWTAAVLDSGDPAYYAVFDEQFQFDCKTTTAWTLRTLFYQRPTPLSSSNKTNFLTTRYPHILRMACLATGARFNRDDETFAREQRLLFASIDEANAKDEMARSTYVPVRT